MRYLSPFYTVVDSHTGLVVSTHATRRRAQAKADRLDLAYGAVRYVVRYVA